MASDDVTPLMVTPTREFLAPGISEANITGDSRVWVLRGVGQVTSEEQQELISSGVSTLAEVANFSPTTRARIRSAWPSVNMAQLEFATQNLLSSNQVSFTHYMTLTPSNLDSTAPLRVAASVLPELRNNTHLLNLPHPRDPAPDQFYGSKDRQNKKLSDELTTAVQRIPLLGESVQPGWQEGFLLLLECNLIGTTQWLYHKDRRNDVALRTLASVVIPNPTVEPLVFNAKQYANSDAEWTKLRLVEGTSYHLIFHHLNIKQPGPIFRCVYLDYCGMWSGRKSQTSKRAMQFEYCDPSKEVEELFKNKRFFNFSTLAITAIRSRVKGGGHTVAPTVINDCYRYARESGYRLVLRERLEYFHSSAMVLIIFHVYESQHKPVAPLALGGSRGLVLPKDQVEMAKSKAAMEAIPPPPPVRLTQLNLVGQSYQLPGIPGASKCILSSSGGWRTFYNETLHQTIRRQVRLDLMQRYLMPSTDAETLYLLPNKHEGGAMQLMKLVGQTGGGWKYFVKHDAPANTIPFKIQISVTNLNLARQK